MITVICVLYDSDHLIKPFLSQFEKNRKIEKIIFFDNSKKIDLKLSNKSQVIGTGDNLGYSGAINKAASFATTDWVLVANPDIDIITNNLDETNLSEMTFYAPVEIVNNNKIYGYNFPNLFFDALDKTVFRYFKILSRKLIEKKYLRNNLNMPEKWWQSGALILMPRIFFKKYNGFNTDYFLFYEDSDVYNKAFLCNFKIVSATFLSFTNNSNSSKNDVSDIKAYAEMDSFKKFYKKNGNLFLVIFLMKIIDWSHLLIIKFIILFYKNNQIIKRLKFLKYQLRGLSNKEYKINKK